MSFETYASGWFNLIDQIINDLVKLRAPMKTPAPHSPALTKYVVVSGSYVQTSARYFFTDAPAQAGLPVWLTRGFLSAPV